MGLRLAIRSGLLGASLAFSNAALSCGQGEPAETGSRAPTDLTASIYWLAWSEHSVAINRSGLDGRQVQIARRDIADGPHYFETNAMSPNRRQVLFVDRSDTSARQQVVLFDAGSGRLREILSLPSWALTTSDFSPDGSKLAIYATNNGDDSKPQEEGLYLVDTSAAQVRFLGAPHVFDDGRREFGDPYWSSVGNALFLEIEDKYFRVDLDSGKFVPVRGWNATDSHHYGVVDRPDFELRGRRVAMQDEVRPQSGLLLDAQRSANGSRAYIDSHRVLWVERDGKRQRVFARPPDPPPYIGPNGEQVVLACGPEFGIQGWLEDRILFYQYDSVSYGYDVEHDASFFFAKTMSAGDYWW